MALQLGGTALLLHMDGSNGSQVFTDSSVAPRTISVAGTAQISTAQSVFGSSSAAVNGTSNYLYTTLKDPVGSGDFTLELWASLTQATGGYQNLIDFGYASPTLRFGDGGFGQKLQVAVLSHDGSLIYSCNITQTSFVGTGFHHIAFVRKAGRVYLFVDGVKQWLGTGVNPSTYPSQSYSSPYDASSRSLSVGYGFVGYLDEVHIALGIAKYTEDFIPPSAPLKIVAGVPVNTFQTGDYTIGRGSAGFNARPVLQRKTTDLRDRAPYGMPMTLSELVGDRIYRPWQFKGRGRIAGTVKEKASPTDKPVARRVRLYREPDGRLVRTTWSDPVTGAYEFSGIPMDTKYTVVSHDYLTLYRAVLADNLAPELIP
jgi:hypothetical protein